MATVEFEKESVIEQLSHLGKKLHHAELELGEVANKGRDLGLRVAEMAAYANVSESKLYQLMGIAAGIPEKLITVSDYRKMGWVKAYITVCRRRAGDDLTTEYVLKTNVTSLRKRSEFRLKKLDLWFTDAQVYKIDKVLGHEAKHAGMQATPEIKAKLLYDFILLAEQAQTRRRLGTQAD